MAYFDHERWAQRKKRYSFISNSLGYVNNVSFGLFVINGFLFNDAAFVAFPSGKAFVKNFLCDPNGQEYVKMVR